MIWPNNSELRQDANSLVDGLLSGMNLNKFNLTGITKQSSNQDQLTYDICFDGDFFRNHFVNDFVNKTDSSDIMDLFFESIFTSWRDLEIDFTKTNYYVAHMTMRFGQLEHFNENCQNFLRDYPCGYIIFTIRDLYDWFASYINLKKATPYSGVFSDAIKYLDIYFDGILELGLSNNVILLDYDELVSHPRSTLESLLNRLGVDWSDEILRTTFNSHDWYPNSSFDLERKPFISSNGRGKGLDHLSNDQVIQIDNALRAKYEYLKSMCSI